MGTWIHRAGGALFGLLLAAASLGQVTNGGFESPTISGWVANPTGVPGWAFVGSGGLANGATPWSSSPRSGNQYAYLQTAGANSGRMTQTMAGLSVGTMYRLRFWIQKRPGFNTPEIGVRRDGQAIMTPASGVGLWMEVATDWFTATATSAVFEFYVVQSSQDMAMAVDDVSLEVGPPTPGLPLNGSFEDPVFPPGTFLYGPAGANQGWKYIGSAGLERGPGSWGQNAAHGSQYAFIQRSAAIEQVIGSFLPNRTYHVEWYMSRRNGGAGGNSGQPIRALFDQLEIFPFTLHDSPVWTNFASIPFVPGASGTLRFEGGENTLDRSELIDHVRVFANTDLAPNALTVVLGTVVSGGVPELVSSDDASLLVRPATDVNRLSDPVELVVETVAPTMAITYLALTIESASSATSPIQRVDLWNATTSQWVRVLNQSISNVDTVAHAVRLDDAADFVDPTTGKIKCRISSAQLSPLGSRNWIYRLDFVRFSVTPF